jgi:hypothetical protein
MAKKQAAKVEAPMVETYPEDVAQESTPVDPGVILQLDPNTILADDNTRFNLKDSRIQTLAESILAQNGVIEPIEVEPLAEENANGFKYRLTVGFYRHAAVKFLNTTQAAGLTIPTLIHVNPNPAARLQRQLAENIERENQSPMDCAVAIKRLMDIGMSRIEIRQVFSRPSSRKNAKGKPEPASNAWVNMMLSFLDLPKSAQDKIHNGILGVAAAYQLTKVPKERQTEIIARAEEERQKELEREEREEEKFLTNEKKLQEQTAKVEEAKANLQAAEVKNAEASEKLDKQTALTAELFKVSKGKHNTPKDKKAAESAFKEAEKARVTLENAATKAQEEYEKAQVLYGKLTEEKVKKVSKVAEERTKKAAISPANITKAAKDTGAAVGAVPLTRSEMMDVVMEMASPTGDSNPANKKVQAIGEALKNCFGGITIPKDLFKELKKIVG